MTRDERDAGAIAVVVAVFAVVAFGFAAIIVDLGYARMLKARAQDAADSAALAAAAELYADGGLPKFAQAANEAKDNALAVMGLPNSQWSSVCVDPAQLLGKQQGPCVSFDSAADPRQIRVHVRVPDTDDNIFFAGIFGYSKGVSISASAVASLGPVTFTPACAICVLSDEPQSVAGQVRATDADISFAGNVNLVGDGLIEAEDRTVFLGGEAGGDPLRFKKFLVTKVADIPVPLAVEQAPEGLEPRAEACSLDNTIGGSGIYDGDVTLAGACTLLPGTYVVTGDLRAAPDAVIVGNGVQFRVDGSVDLSAAASLDLTALDDRSLVYARGGPANIRLFGAPVASISGDINAPDASFAGSDLCDGLPDLFSVEGLIVVEQLDVGAGQCLESTATTNRTTGETEPPVLIR